MEFNSDILFYAFRYALGRKTYAVSDVVNCLEENWSELNYKDKTIIQKEIQEAIKEGNAGMDMDIVQWQKILNLKKIK